MNTVPEPRKAKANRLPPGTYQMRAESVEGPEVTASGTKVYTMYAKPIKANKVDGNVTPEMLAAAPKLRYKFFDAPLKEGKTMSATDVSQKTLDAGLGVAREGRSLQDQLTEVEGSTFDAVIEHDTPTTGKSAGKTFLKISRIFDKKN